MKLLVRISITCIIIFHENLMYVNCKASNLISVFIFSANIENIVLDNIDQNEKIVVIGNNQYHSDIKNTSACDPPNISESTSNRKPRIINNIICKNFSFSHEMISLKLNSILLPKF